jgi:hypothetical protein
MLTDQGDGRRRVVRGLIFTAVYSRHMFVCPTYRQTLGDVIAGFEAAWAFFWRGVRRGDVRLCGASHNRTTVSVAQRR